MVVLASLGGALLGALLGSFLATLVLRWPDQPGVPLGRSRCDHCGRTLGALDLVPLLSALFQRGRCRTCRAPIDPLHWRIELTCAAIGGGALALSPDAAGAVLAIMGWMLVPLAWIDARHQWLPDPLTLAFALVGLVLGGQLGVPLADRLTGAAAGYAALWLVARTYRLVRRRHGLGGGDPKLLGAVGAWIGWVPLAPVLALAAAIGLAVALIRRLRSTDALPLGTMIAPAAWLAAAAIVAGA